MIKTGILGGTFNPIHFAHLAMAETALGQAQLEQIWFMPSKNPPHKSHQEIVSEYHRSQMIRLAIETRPYFYFSDFELTRRGTTYTADTLQLLQKAYPDRIFCFILGGDSFFALENWYQPDTILKSCEILAVSRNGVTGQQMQKKADELRETYQAKIRILQMENMDISSSKIRAAVGRGQEITGLVPEGVVEYIYQHRLYW